MVALEDTLNPYQQMGHRPWERRARAVFQVEDTQPENMWRSWGSRGGGSVVVGVMVKTELWWSPGLKCGTTVEVWGDRMKEISLTMGECEEKIFTRLRSKKVLGEKP
ncbi:hypothetical protein A2U01_0026732 [Trifolium medium]|uniref:Uncharacterized protein n=1 Tax=Trifolium medium TaxID=97028 RepID=A0A392P2P8_9FABA|nr:hypothetical protein [Trifolium medium]